MVVVVRRRQECDGEGGWAQKNIAGVFGSSHNAGRNDQTGQKNKGHRRNRGQGQAKGDAMMARSDVAGRLGTNKTQRGKRRTRTSGSDSADESENGKRGDVPKE